MRYIKTEEPNNFFARQYEKWKNQPVKNQLIQDKGNCYLYACLNALRYHSPTFAQIGSRGISEIIKDIEEIVGKTRSVPSILNALKTLGYIIDWHEEKSRLIYFMKKLGCAVITQKIVYGLPKSPLQKQNAVFARIKKGLGIQHHALASMGYSNIFGLKLINAWKRIPRLCLKDLDQISHIYKIEVNERS